MRLAFVQPVILHPYSTSEPPAPTSHTTKALTVVFAANSQNLPQLLDLKSLPVNHSGGAEGLSNQQIGPSDKHASITRHGELELSMSAVVTSRRQCPHISIVQTPATGKKGLENPDS